MGVPSAGEARQGSASVLHGQNLTATLKTFFDRGYGLGSSKNRRMFLYLIKNQREMA